MSASLTETSGLTISPEVQEFAVQKGVGEYLEPVIDLARRAFPSTSLAVSVGRDAEDETYHYLALDVEVGSLTAEELLAGQRTWSAGLSHVCPSPFAVFFVLGWQ